MSSCLVIEDSRLARKELVQLLEKVDAFNEIKEAQDAETALKLLDTFEPDVIFLDIHLPEVNGFDFLEKLDVTPKIIFTTAYDEYALKAFDYNTIDYLLKPIKQSSLEAAIEKLDLSKQSPNSKVDADKQIFVRDGEKCWFVKLNDIRLFESVGNYSMVHFDDQKPLIQKSLNYLEGVLDQGTFLRVNRKQIINLNFVAKMDSWFKGKLKIVLKNGKEIEVSRRQSQRIKNLFSL